LRDKRCYGRCNRAVVHGHRFLQTSYEAAAELGGWDRSALECDPDRLLPWPIHRS
jgi:hypothetical protein